MFAQLPPNSRHYPDRWGWGDLQPSDHIFILILILLGLLALLILAQRRRSPQDTLEDLAMRYRHKKDKND